MAYDTYEDTPAENLTGENKLQRFKDWLRLSSEAEADQRRREREDLLFQVGENQWTEEAKEARTGRPMLSVSLLQQPLQLVQNQADQADLSVKLSPVNEAATDELAEIKQGLYMRIQRDGGAKVARMWALDRAKQCGRGWYRVCTQYDEDSDNPSDQEIVYERILYQEMVYPDPAATKPDFSDARFIAVAAYVPCADFKRQYPQAKSYGESVFAALQNDPGPDWVRAGEAGKDPLVVELFYKEAQPEEVKIPGTSYSRKREKAVVRRAVLTGCEVLEDEEWIGHYIPIIPVIGRELQPVDGKRRWEGMVGPSKDGQRTYNYAISSIVEDVSRISKATVVGAAGQFAGFEKNWLESNTRNFPYLEYNTVDSLGKPVPPPMPMQIDGTKMQLSMQLAQEARGFVQTTTAVHEPSLGEFQRGDKGQSGRAIMALQQQADAGTGNYLGNLASISLLYEARVVLDLMPVIYDRPGRITQVLGGEDEAKTVMLNAPFVMSQDGRPMPPPPQQPGMPPPQGVKQYNLADGKYSIAPVVGKSAQTRLQQGADEIGQILGADPGLMAVIGDIYFRFRDFPGHDQIADRLAKLREKTNPGLGEDENGQPNPEQLQAQNQALQQQVQQMQAQLMEAAEAIKTDQAKQQATLQKAQMDAEAALQKAQIDAQAALQKAEAEGQLKVVLQQLQDAQATKDAAQEHAFEVALQRMKQEFEEWKVKFEAAHEVGMAAAAGRTATLTRDRGQSDEREDGRETNQGQSSQPERDEAGV